mmetsp:Transcript_17681/g.49328  ORF Transcript_17681/g.49328 Transcript_17681/m.49328 type:complete len:216 (-) Transcript_17681:544-1191(-)
MIWAIDFSGRKSRCMLWNSRLCWRRPATKASSSTGVHEALTLLPKDSMLKALTRFGPSRFSSISSTVASMTACRALRLGAAFSLAVTSLHRPWCGGDKKGLNTSAAAFAASAALLRMPRIPSPGAARGFLGGALGSAGLKARLDPLRRLCCSPSCSPGCRSSHLCCRREGRCCCCCCCFCCFAAASSSAARASFSVQCSKCHWTEASVYLIFHML